MKLLLWFALACMCALSGGQVLAAVTMVLLVGCATDRVRY